jgi:hypothetical protein
MRTILMLASIFAASAAIAQSAANRAREEQTVKQIEEAQALAEANAVRPGDENLSCEALQAEMMALAQSPEMQAFAQGFGAQAQADLAGLQQAQTAAEEQTRNARRGIFRSMAQGVASAVTPGADQAAARAQQAASKAQSAQIEAQTNQNLERILGQSDNIAAMAGPAMRGRRVFELAEARDCAWLKEGGMPPGAFPPGSAPPGLALPPQPGSAPPGLSLPPQPGSAPAR